MSLLDSLDTSQKDEDEDVKEKVAKCFLPGALSTKLRSILNKFDEILDNTDDKV